MWGTSVVPLLLIAIEASLGAFVVNQPQAKGHLPSSGSGYQDTNKPSWLSPEYSKPSPPSKPIDYTGGNNWQNDYLWKDKNSYDHGNNDYLWKDKNSYDHGNKWNDNKYDNEWDNSRHYDDGWGKPNKPDYIPGGNKVCEKSKFAGIDWKGATEFMKEFQEMLKYLQCDFHKCGLKNYKDYDRKHDWDKSYDHGSKDSYDWGNKHGSYDHGSKDSYDWGNKHSSYDHDSKNSYDWGNKKDKHDNSYDNNNWWNNKDKKDKHDNNNWWNNNDKKDKHDNSYDNNEHKKNDWNHNVKKSPPVITPFDFQADQIGENIGQEQVNADNIGDIIQS